MLYLYIMKKKDQLYDVLGEYDDWETILRLINFTTSLKKYPIEMIIAKHLYLCGINTEAKLIELLKRSDISYPMMITLQNCMRDFNNTSYINIDDIPSLPKLE